MNKILITTVASALLAVSAKATNYSGNSATGFGGPIGLGSLTLTDNGTTLSGTFNKGPNSFNNSLVIYIDSTGGGFADTSGFADGADGLRRSISGFDGGGNRSTLTFASGFAPDYAIALGPQNASFGGLWSLANGGANSLGFISSVGLTPLNDSSATYTFSLSLASIGISAGQSFELFGTYVSDSGYRSDETVAGNATGTQGWNAFSQTAFGIYSVPEPGTLALAAFGSMGMLLTLRRR
jgi:hypothetical protein